MGEVNLFAHNPDAFVPPPSNTNNLYRFKPMATPPNSQELYSPGMLLERNGRERITVVVGGHLCGKSQFVMRMCSHLAQEGQHSVACVLGSNHMFRVFWQAKINEDWRNVEVYSATQAVLPDDHGILIIDDVQKTRDLVSSSGAVRIIATCNQHDFAIDAMPVVGALASLVVPDNTNDIPGVIYLYPPNPADSASAAEMWRRHLVDTVAKAEPPTCVGFDRNLEVAPSADLPTLNIYNSAKAASDAMDAIVQERRRNGLDVTLVAYKKHASCKTSRPIAVWEGMLVRVLDWNVLGVLVGIYQPETPYFVVQVGTNVMNLSHVDCAQRGCYHLPIEPLETVAVDELPWISFDVNLVAKASLTSHPLLKVARAGAPILNTLGTLVSQPNVLQTADSLPRPGEQ